jgi:hypothetical protein
MNRGAVAGVAADVRSGSKADMESEAAMSAYDPKRTLSGQICCSAQRGTSTHGMC